MKKKMNTAIKESMPPLLPGLEIAETSLPAISSTPLVIPRMGIVATSETNSDTERALLEVKVCFENVSKIQGIISKANSALKDKKTELLFGKMELGRGLTIAKLFAPHGQFENLRKKIVPDLPARTASEAQKLFRLVSSTEKFKCPTSQQYLDNPQLIEAWTDEAIREEFKDYTSIQEYVRSLPDARRSIFDSFTKKRSSFGPKAIKLVLELLAQCKPIKSIDQELVDDIEKLIAPKKVESSNASGE